MLRFVAALVLVVALVGSSPAASLDGLQKFSIVISTGATTALSAGNPVISLRSPSVSSTRRVVIRSMRLTAVQATGFASAFILPVQVFLAKSYTASDSGGTAIDLSTGDGKIRTASAASSLQDLRVAATGTLTAGTRTLQTSPVYVATFTTSTAAGGLPANGSTFNTAGETPPIILEPDEGLVFVIGTTYTATGTLAFTLQLSWDEAPGVIPAGVFE